MAGPCLTSRTAAKFGQLTVPCAFKGNEAAEKPVPKWDMEPLRAGFHRGRVERIVVGLGVDGAEQGWLVGGDADHAALPASALLGGGVGVGLDVGEQQIVVALQCRVKAREATEIEDELQRTDHSDGEADPDLAHIEGRESIGRRRRSEYDDQKVEEAVPALERPPSGGVVEGVAQNIEADVLAVWGHGHFSGGGFVPGDGDGCRGPTLLSGSFGWRGPAELIEIFSPPGLRLPWSIACSVFLFIPIVSFWSVQKGMKAPGGAVNVPRCRQPITLNPTRKRLEAA